MCDAFSAMSFMGDLGNGVSQKISERAKGNFDGAQVEAMALLASAQGSDETAALRADFARLAEVNMAAMAVSGLAAESFEAVQAGNREDMRKNAAQIDRNAESQSRQYLSQAELARAEGEIAGAVALMGGLMAGIGTLKKAEDSYQDSHTGQSRGEYLKDSLSRNSSFFRKK